jgi:hypothetical protein
MASLLAADQCADFCKLKLGNSACAKGSYCKGTVCHALFWFTPSEICVHGSGNAMCGDFLPKVTCDQARDALTPGDDPSTTSTTTSTTSTASSDQPRIVDPVPRLGYALLDCSMNELVADDTRPRVMAQFLAHDTGVVYSILFDTGSVSSYMVRNRDQHPTIAPAHGDRDVLREAKAGEGFGAFLERLVSPAHGELIFGDASLMKAVPVEERVVEMIQLVGKLSNDRFAHQISVLLTPKNDDPFVGIGLLGASRNSEFSRHAVCFSFVPRGALVDERVAGHVLVGERDQDKLSMEYCSGRAFIDCDLDLSDPDYWVISGGIHAQSPLAPDAFPPRPVSWIVDTGAGYDEGHYVTQEAFEDLVRAIEFTGARVDDFKPGFKVRVRNCQEHNVGMFPNLTFSVTNTRGLTMSIIMSPKDYLIRLPERPTVCYLRVNPSGIDGRSPQTRVLGMGFLNKVVTIFDTELGQVSFCPVLDS